MCKENAKVAGRNRAAEWQPGPVRSASIAIILLAAIQTARFAFPAQSPVPKILICGCPVQLEGPAGPVVCWKPGKARSALAPCHRDIDNNEILPGSRLSCRGTHLVVGRMDSALLRHLAVPICLNRANEMDLMSIRGIGPGLARRMLTFRKNHGDFATNESLLLVPGIGPGLLRRIRPRLLDPSQCSMKRASAASTNSLTHPPNP